MFYVFQLPSCSWVRIQEDIHVVFQVTGPFPEDGSIFPKWVTGDAKGRTAGFRKPCGETVCPPTSSALHEGSVL